MTTVRICVVVGLLAASLLAVGCGGKEEQAPLQAVEQRDEPSEQPRTAPRETPQEATPQQERRTAVSESASEVGRSGEVEARQSKSDEDQSSAEVGEQSVHGTFRLRDGDLVVAEALDCESSGSAVEAELAAARESTEHGDGDRANGRVELEDEEREERRVLLEAANE
ncbi:MAG: hypothetical protein OXG42_06245, partial [Chloroflexi bacterium]|nr:hypothetical protein [Chloroflexota bacterium]